MRPLEPVTREFRLPITDMAIWVVFGLFFFAAAAFIMWTFIRFVSFVRIPYQQPSLNSSTCCSLCCLCGLCVLPFCVSVGVCCLSAWCCFGCRRIYITRHCYYYSSLLLVVYRVNKVAPSWWRCVPWLVQPHSKWIQNLCLFCLLLHTRCTVRSNLAYCCRLLQVHHTHMHSHTYLGGISFRMRCWINGFVSDTQVLLMHTRRAVCTKSAYCCRLQQVHHTKKWIRVSVFIAVCRASTCPSAAGWADDWARRFVL